MIILSEYDNKSVKGKKPKAKIISHLPVKNDKKASPNPKKQEEEDDDDLEDDEEMECEGHKKRRQSQLLQKNQVKMMMMMMMAKMNRMNGKNPKKKKSGILTSRNSMFLNQRLKKVPVLLPEVKKVRKKKMILKWMMNSRNGFMMIGMTMMKKMITKKILFPVLYFERNQY